MSEKLKSIELVEKERIRQIEQEGCTFEKDLQLNYGELALAGVSYATPIPLYEMVQFNKSVQFVDPYPWTGGIGDKRMDYLAKNDELSHNTLSYEAKLDLLVKGAALICAEIDRLINFTENGKQE